MIYLKASFIKRLGAFIIDTMILSIVFSLITLGFNTDTNNINKELTSILEQYQNSEISLLISELFTSMLL